MKKLQNAEARKEAVERCSAETATAERYAIAAEKHAANGHCSAAWGCVDTARCAAKCAMQAHEALWSASKGKLTDDEFEVFEAAEVVQFHVSRAARAAAKSVEDATAAYHAAH